MIRVVSLQRYASVALLAFGLAACGVKRPEGVLADEQMQAVLYDYHLAKAMGEDVPYDESYKKLLYVESVYRKHGITREQFDSSMAWYAHNSVEMAKLYEKITPALKRERDAVNRLIALRDNKPRESVSGDSVDVWGYEPRYRLTGYPLHNRVSFDFRTDTCFHPTDKLEWSARFRFYGVMPTGEQAPVMALQLVYEDDSLCQTVHTVGRSGVASVAVGNDTLGALRGVRGFIYYPRPAVPEAGVHIDGIKLMRYHQAPGDSIAKRKQPAGKAGDKKPDARKKTEAKPAPAPANAGERLHRPARASRNLQKEVDVAKPPVKKPTVRKPL